MNLAQRYKINKESVVSRVIGGEAVMLNLENGYYYSLDEIGTQIWQAIEKHKVIGEVFEALKEDYLVSERQLEKDILKLLSSLEKANLIKRVLD